jgi:hypothetical protein
MSELVRRRFLFFLEVSRTGAVAARGLNSDFEFHADNVVDLRRALAAELGPLGLDWHVVGVRTDSPLAEA